MGNTLQGGSRELLEEGVSNVDYLVNVLLDYLL